MTKTVVKSQKKIEIRMSGKWSFLPKFLILHPENNELSE